MKRELVKRQRNNRGFTLIELMVSLSAGLIVSASAFMMARNATQFFQHESGITSAQYSVMVGFARLQADLKNVSFLSTPNVAVDDANGRFCGAVGSLTPQLGGAAHPGMQDLAGVRLVADGSVTEVNALGFPAVAALWATNGMAPDSITIGGSFDTTEQFMAASISPVGGARTVTLNNVSHGAFARTWLADQRGGATFHQIFVPGRILRVRDREGRYSLGVIASVDPVAPNPITDRIEITLEGGAAFVTREQTDNCGCTGLCVGAPVSVITRMHYGLRPAPPGGSYANLYLNADLTTAARVTQYHRGPPPALGRSDLIRVEVAANGTELANTLQVIAEHAVDLEFGASFEPAANPVDPPLIVREPVGESLNGTRYTLGAAPSAGGRPDLLRSLQVRLSARAHRRDRDVGVAALSDGTALRFNLGANRGFARMRTLVADVALLNQRERLLP